MNTFRTLTALVSLGSIPGMVAAQEAASPAPETAAAGGAIRIITRRPSFDAQARVSADYGIRYGELRSTAYLTGPLGDNVAASLSAAYRTGGDFIRGMGPNRGREYGGANNYLVRGKLLVRASDTFEATLAADVSSTQNEVAFSSGIRGAANPFPGHRCGAERPLHVRGIDPAADRRQEPRRQPRRELASWR